MYRSSIQQFREPVKEECSTSHCKGNCTYLLWKLPYTKQYALQKYEIINTEPQYHLEDIWRGKEWKNLKLGWNGNETQEGALHATLT